MSTFQSQATIYLTTFAVFLAGYFVLTKVLAQIAQRKTSDGSSFDRFAGNALRLWLLFWLLIVVFSFVGAVVFAISNYCWFMLHPQPLPHHHAVQISK